MVVVFKRLPSPVLARFGLLVVGAMAGGIFLSMSGSFSTAVATNPALGRAASKVIDFAEITAPPAISSGERLVVLEPLSAPAAPAFAELTLTIGGASQATAEEIAMSGGLLAQQLGFGSQDD